MRHFRILSIAYVCFKAIFILNIIAFFIVFIVGTHSLFYPQVYNNFNVTVNNGYKLSYSNNSSMVPSTYKEYNELKATNIYYSKLTLGSKLSLMIPLVLGFVFYFLVLKELLNFVKSINKYSSFFGNSYKCFRNIGLYLSAFLIYYAIIIIVGGKLTMTFPDGNIIRVNYFLDLTFVIEILFFTILAFVISIVFKEGEHIRLENDLTI